MISFSQKWHRTYFVLDKRIDELFASQTFSFTLEICGGHLCIDESFIPYLDNGIIKNLKITNYDLFNASLIELF